MRPAGPWAVAHGNGQGGEDSQLTPTAACTQCALSLSDGVLDRCSSLMPLAVCRPAAEHRLSSPNVPCASHCQDADMISHMGGLRHHVCEASAITPRG